MKPRIRIYKIHDYDLMCYYFGKKSENITFAKLIKRLIRDYMNGESLSAPRLLEIERKNFPLKVETNIYFFEPEDADIIAFLNNIIPGQRNGFFKNLLRQSIFTDDLVKCYTKGNMLNLQQNHEIEEPKPHSKSSSSKKRNKAPKPETANRNEVIDPIPIEPDTGYQPENSEAFDLFGAFEKMIER